MPTLDVSRLHKRLFNGEDEQDDGCSRVPKRPMIAAPREENSIKGLPYACPFQKRPPDTSGLCGLAYGAKTTYGWESIARKVRLLIIVICDPKSNLVNTLEGSIFSQPIAETTIAKNVGTPIRAPKKLNIVRHR